MRRRRRKRRSCTFVKIRGPHLAGGKIGESIGRCDANCQMLTVPSATPATPQRSAVEQDAMTLQQLRWAHAGRWC